MVAGTKDYVVNLVQYGTVFESYAGERVVFGSRGINYGGGVLAIVFGEEADFAYPSPVLRKVFFRTVVLATTSALVYIFRKGAEFSRDIEGRNASANEENVLIR